MYYKNWAQQILISILLILLLFSLLVAQNNKSAAIYNVVWNSLGTNENSSMPLGNGDIGLNVWTEQNGDIVLLIAKSDAWSENGQLLKLGRVRINLSPNPFTNSASFTQILKLESGEVELRSGSNVVDIWVDANHPAAHVQVRTEAPVQMKVSSEIWRTKNYYLNKDAVVRGGFFEWGNNPDGLTFEPDTILAAKDNRLAWCHFNKSSIYPLVFEKQHLASLLSKYPDPINHRCFGISMKGNNLVSSNDQTLISAKNSNSQQLDIYMYTGQAESAASWRDKIDNIINEVDAVEINKALDAHKQWWTNFWDRSWVYMSGSHEAEKVSQSYAMQRYMTACAGRGKYPVKFNGSLFSVGHNLPEDSSSTETDHNPDYRRWGACYWNQNNRHMYWPLIASGDYDLIKPWFDMYVNALPLVKDRTSEYFHHEGAAFIETIYFWGLPNVNDFGWNNSTNELQSPWIRHHIQGGLEVIAQMLDYYNNTLDADFAHNSLLPMADAVIAFYNNHYSRDANGKILIQPAQSIETYQETAVNPTPDIAGLKFLLPQLLLLPSELINAEERNTWTKVLNDLPEIPIGTTAKGKLPPKGVGDPNGDRVILPAREYDEPRNGENPELYTVFPYRLYGAGKPDLQLARNTFNARLFPFVKCWGQDGLHSTLLGMTDAAKNAVIQAFTSYGDQRFQWFWSKNSDWIPDMDNGGSGAMALQLMLMQCDGKRIQLLPAWPKDWAVDFKLHAPYKTIIEGHVENGKVTIMKVTPEERSKDIIIAN